MAIPFCPYDNHTFDFRNLAYELTFPKGWDWKRVKEKTGLGHITKLKENDIRRADRFGTDNTNNLIILQECSQNDFNNGGKNGIAFLLEEIIRKKEVQGKIANENSEDDEEGKSNKIVLDFTWGNDGIYTFFDESTRVEVMYAYPCCPYCHHRLPVGWLQAEDFIAISLMARTGGGKTTFLYSMMHQNWRAFQNIENNELGRIHIKPAHRVTDFRETAYAEMKEKSEKMCKKGGTCPNNTDTEKWIYPVFLQVEYNGHILIVGIYDNAGENLQNLNPQQNTNLKLLFQNTLYAHLFLFDPANLNVELPLEDIHSKELPMNNYKILTIEEQAKCQQENSGNRINASVLLEHLEQEKNEMENHRQNAIEDNIYKELEVYTQYELLENLENLRNMRFYGVIVKSDLLEQTKIGNDNKYRSLFERRRTRTMWSADEMAVRNNVVKEMISEYQLFGEETETILENFENKFGTDHVKWQCISALGCKTKDKVLENDYRPIRVEEPIVTCIINRIAENIKNKIW